MKSQQHGKPVLHFCKTGFLFAETQRVPSSPDSPPEWGNVRKTATITGLLIRIFARLADSMNVSRIDFLQRNLPKLMMNNKLYPEWQALVQGLL